jgi:hypothetical protein
LKRRIFVADLQITIREFDSVKKTHRTFQLLVFFSFFFCLYPLSSALALKAHLTIKGPFSSFAEANRQCMKCHEKQTNDLYKSTHWSWQRQRIINGATVLSDKSTDLSRFGIAAGNNPTACRRCHLSAMPGTPSMAIRESATINCLICHDTTGTYEPDVELSTLVLIAQTAGRPSAHNCRTCHDRECGLAPETGRSSVEDIHLLRYGFTCQKCHPGNNHHDFKRSATHSTNGQKTQGCSSCHGKNPHALARLNQHAILIGCQSCHIPEYGNNSPAVISWNWLLDDSAYPLHQRKDALVLARGFSLARNITPIYFWDNGSDELYTRGTRIVPEHTNRLQGPGPRTPASKIMPFTMHTGTQLYDIKYRYLLSPKLYGSQAPFFKGADLNAAVTEGMHELRLPYSGRYGVTTTVAFRRLNHGVAGVNKTLGCLDCHGSAARFNWRRLGYEQDPWTGGRKNLKIPPPVQELPTIGLPPVQESVLPVTPGMPMAPPQ